MARIRLRLNVIMMIQFRMSRAFYIHTHTHIHILLLPRRLIYCQRHNIPLFCSHFQWNCVSSSLQWWANYATRISFLLLYCCWFERKFVWNSTSQMSDYALAGIFSYLFLYTSRYRDIVHAMTNRTQIYTHTENEKRRTKWNRLFWKLTFITMNIINTKKISISQGNIFKK